MEESEFEQQIKEYEDTMFGLILYHETSPKWVQKLQKTSYKNMKRRGEKALKNAKRILLDAKKSKTVQNQFEYFEWPIIIDEMRFRIDLLLSCYQQLFPERPKEKPLEKEEIVSLRNEAMSRLPY
ncbi:MAG TPA: hypothetical protein DIU00_22480 [Phycisphaerales bacterium]|nr:hypothetical protein [Phycisphaerales bacterium]